MVEAGAVAEKESGCLISLVPSSLNVLIINAFYSFPNPILNLSKKSSILFGYRNIIETYSLLQPEI